MAAKVNTNRHARKAPDEFIPTPVGEAFAPTHEELPIELPDGVDIQDLPPKNGGRWQYGRGAAIEYLKYAAQGFTESQTCARMRTASSTFRRWESAHEGFREVVKYARDLRQAWWEDAGRDSLQQKYFQTLVWQKTMGALFPDTYQDRRGADTAVLLVHKDMWGSNRDGTTGVKEGRTIEHAPGHEFVKLPAKPETVQ